MRDDVLSLDAAADEHGDSLAVLAEGHALRYDELRARCAALGETARVFRTPATLGTLETIHAAMLQARWFAPLHPASPDAAESKLLLRLRSLSVAESTRALLSTSGSTGEPKLVELSAASLAAHAVASNAHLGVGCDDRWLVALPLAHTGGLSSVVRCLVARAAVVLAPAPSLGAGFGAWLVDRTRTFGITRWSLVPAQLQQLLSEGLRVPPSLRSILVGGQALSARVADQAIDGGWPVVTSYGLTETCGVCVATKIGERPGGSVGSVLPGVSLRVVNEQLELAGDVVTRRIHGHDHAFTADGWLRTADRARLGSDGTLTVLGRADDVIVASGHKIDPLEVEAALLACPEVAHAVVVGLPDPRFGATVAALLVPAPSASDESVRTRAQAAVESTLARYKQPRVWHVAHDLPLLASGKIDRAAVARLLGATPTPPR